MPEKNFIYIYNTLTREKGPFNPIEEGKVGMYVCGPTVYDEPHIGHARSAYIFDVIRRYLKYRGYQVEFVRNVTDVDDKIIEKAKQEYPGEDLKSAVSKVSEKYLKSYHEAMNKLGLDEPNKEPKATEYIEKMQDFIKILIERGMAYESQGDVYFDIKKAKGYGSLSHQSLEKMEVGARIAPGENKKDPLDFALWKKAKEGEPSWPSPWGNGRPGWHIECSVMSSDILGDEFDIHGGGLDLIFPHHENELAQSRGAGKNFARYWIHHGLLTINGQKMSKSLGNFVTVEEVLKRYPPNVLKLFYLQALYNSPVDFTWERMEEKRTALNESIIRFFGNIEKAKNNNNNIVKIIDINKNLSNIDELYKKIDQEKLIFKHAMDNDFNTPIAVASLFTICRKCEGIPLYTTYNNEKHLPILEHAKRTIEELGKILGLYFDTPKEVDFPPEIKEKINEREKARAKKDFKEADRLRKEVEEQGYILEDTTGGPICHKKL